MLGVTTKQSLMFPTRLKSSNQQPVPFTPDNRAKKNPINFQDPFVQEFFEKKKISFSEIEFQY